MGASSVRRALVSRCSPVHASLGRLRAASNAQGQS